MAKNDDNSGGGQVPVGGASALIMQALGDHAEQQGLVQGEGEEEIAFAVRCIEKLGGLVTAMDGNIRAFEAETAGLRTEVKSLNRRLASQRGATTKARSEIIELKEASKPRALGPLGEASLDVLDLMTAIDAAFEVVLAFSDGENELRGIKPRQVDPASFVLRGERVLFDDDTLSVTGPGDDETATTLLAGVALLIDGEQLGWSPMAQPLHIGAGQTMNLAGSVFFG